jgi:hypothetical protein
VSGKIYKPVTILSENEWGQLGSEFKDEGYDVPSLAKRVRELQDDGWEPIEIQVGESQYSIPFWDIIEKGENGGQTDSEDEDPVETG